MAEPWVTHTLGAWLLTYALLTYALHSTVLGAIVWLVARWVRGDGDREWLWRIALFGGALTTVLQLAAGIQPAAGALLHVAVKTDLLPSVAPPMLVDAPAAPVAAPFEMAAGSAAPGFPFGFWLTASILAVAFGLLLHLGGAYWSLRRRLRDATPEPELAALAAELAPFPVSVTSSARIRTPMALGVLRRREICVPRRVSSELSKEEQRAMLAHELAHLGRRDPLFSLVMAVYCRLFWWQPLHWLARRHLVAIAELRCDADAAAALPAAGGVALARVLVRAAGWITPRSLPAAVVGRAMAVSPGELGRRVTRLLEPNPSPRAVGRVARIVAAAALASGTFWLPAGVGLRQPAEAAAVVPLAVVAPSLAVVSGELDALRRDFDDIRDLVRAADFADATIDGLLAAIEQRLAAMEHRRDELVSRARRAHSTAFPNPSATRSNR